MQKWLTIAVALLGTSALAFGSGAKAHHPAKKIIARETKAQKDKRMAWWRDARFGMFIHWGLYSIPAGTWDGKTNYAEWIREEAHIPVGEYEKLKAQFNPVKFDADKWVRMAKDAGMKYITITTKHHDGFNNFDSPLTDWNIGHTPYKKDIMAQMAKACKKYGVKMCWYHSIMDWHHPDYLPRRSWEVAQRPVDGADFRKFVKYLRSEVTWLLTHYGPIGVMWFDGEWESTWNAKDGDALYELCRKLQPNVIVNNRVSVGRGGTEDGEMKAGDYSTPEQFIPPTGLGDVDWETCMTMNDHWGYNSHDKNWKSSKTLIRNLVDIASKGGNYLLNIGPRSDGTFPPEAVERLHDIGQWMHVNGESIYGTKASVFETLPWGRSTTLFREFQNATTLYLQVFDWPKDGRLVIPGIGNKADSAELLTGKRKLKVDRVGPDLVVHVGPKASDANCSVIDLEIEGKPVVYRAPKISTPSEILVDQTTAKLDSGSAELKMRYTLDGSAPSLKSPEYSQPIRIDHSLTLRAASFHHGKMVSPVTEQRFEKVEAKPSVPRGSADGLLSDEFKGSWEKVPDFDTLTPRTRATVNRISLGNSHEENWAKRLIGLINAPKDGVYEFALTSDDGSKLWIDDELVVDNDGLHSPQTKAGHIALAKGWHRIKIGWFNGSGGLDLSLRWGLAGGKLAPVSSAELSH